MDDSVADWVRVEFKRREEWKAYRKRGFGASEASAILEANPWKSAAAVILAKASDSQDEREDVKDQRVRRLLEPGLLKNYLVAAKVDSGMLNDDIWYRRATPHIFATPDAFVPGSPQEVIVELKTSSSTPDRWEDDGVPLAYQVQVQQQMLCCGLARADIGALFTGEGQYAFRVFTFEADPEFQQILVERLTEAWGLVEAIRRGEDVVLPDAGASDGRLLARFRPPVPSKVVQMAAADLALAQRLLARREEHRSYNKIAEGLDELAKADQNALLTRMNGAELATFEGSSLRLTSKLRKRAGFEVGATEWIEVKEAKESSK